jgi:hypothetical protein
MAAIAFKNSQQIVDLIVARCHGARPFEPVCGQVIVPLSQCQHSPIRPSRGLNGHKLSYFRKFALGVNVITDLERRETNIECGDNVGVGF